MTISNDYFIFAWAPIVTLLTMSNLVTDLRYCLSSDPGVVALKTEMKKSHSLPCKGINTKLAILHNTKKTNEDLQNILYYFSTHTM